MLPFPAGKSAAGPKALGDVDQRNAVTAGDTPVSIAATHAQPGPALIPVAISVRHVHLTQGTIDRLFGAGYVLHVHAPLFQPGQYAAEETVALVGPHGRLPHVRIVGPPRLEDQLELSRTDEVALGIDAPLRESGDLALTPGIVIEGPLGGMSIEHGVIRALRHVHISPVEADALGLKNHDRVAVAVTTRGRRLIFGDVVVRVSATSKLELHLDADEGNAAGLHSGENVVLAEIDMDANIDPPR